MSAGAGASAHDVIEVQEWAKPLPHLDPVNAEYWKAARQGRLLIQQCPACGNRQWYPRALCTRCGGTPEWLQASGRGTVHTFTVIRQQGIPAFKAELPYVIVMVELEEGPLVFGSMPGVAPEAVSIGMPVEVYFAAAAEDVGIPYWRPAA